MKIAIQGQEFDITYEEARQLYYDVLNVMRNSPEDKQHNEEVSRRLAEFEKSNKQFPDALFYPKKK